MDLLWVLLAIVFLILFGILVYFLFLLLKQNQDMSNTHFPTYQFIVEWGGTRTGFSEVSGLDVYFQPIEFREGSSPAYAPNLIPGLVKYHNIILKRGIVKGDNDFFNWLNTKQGSSIERRDITISLLNDNHDPAVVWKIRNAFPVRYSGPVLNATDNKIALEELELAHEGLAVEFA